MRWQRVSRLLIGSLATALLLAACAAPKPPEPVAGYEEDDGWVRKSHDDSVREVYPQWPKDW